MFCQHEHCQSATSLMNLTYQQKIGQIKLEDQNFEKKLK
jgi:hypothetical protein